MAKNADIGNFWHIFCHFEAPYRFLNIIKTFFSCRGGSKLQFGGSYVKISQELASEMHFSSR